MPAGTPPASEPFSQLAVSEHQLHSSVMTLGCAVQAYLSNVSTPLSCTASGIRVRGGVIGKFNFGVSTEVGSGGSEGPQVGEAVCFLFHPGSESPLDFSEFSLSGEPRMKRENIFINTTISDSPDEEGPL